MIERILLRIGDYVFVLRPLILIPVWSFYLLGLHASGAPAGPSVYGLLSLTGIMIAAYLINQVFDTDADRLNDKGHYLTTGIFSARTIVLLALVALLAAMQMFRAAPHAQKVPLVLALILSLAYSLPPIRLCSRPFLDLAANAAGYGGVAYVCGYAAAGPDTAAAAWHALPWVLLVGATFLHTTILDAEGDARAHKRTTTVAIGIPASASTALVLAGAGVAAAFLLPNGVIVRTVLPLSLPVFAYGYVTARRGVPASSLVVQGATTVVTVAAVITEPWFLAVLVPLIIAARLYYRSRFGVSYPGPPSRRDA